MQPLFSTKGSFLNKTIMAKKFTIKKHRLRARADHRRWSLKEGAPVFNVKQTPEMKNLEVIRSLESKIKAVQQG